MLATLKKVGTRLPSKLSSGSASGLAISSSTPSPRPGGERHRPAQGIEDGLGHTHRPAALHLICGFHAPRCCACHGHGEVRHHLAGAFDLPAPCGELRGAVGEIDLDASVWVITARRTTTRGLVGM